MALRGELIEVYTGVDGQIAVLPDVPRLVRAPETMGASGRRGASTIAELDDVELTDAAEDEILQLDGAGVWRNVALPAGVTDHGALTGLSDDDHSQYHNDTRGDARYSLLAHTHDDILAIQFDGGGQVLDAATARRRQLPCACTATGWQITGDDDVLSGSAVVEIYYAAYGDFPSWTKISGSTPPTLTTAQKAQGDVSGWSAVALAAGGYLKAVVLSNDAFSILDVAITVTR